MNDQWILDKVPLKRVCNSTLLKISPLQKFLSSFSKILLNATEQNTTEHNTTENTTGDLP